MRTLANLLVILITPLLVKCLCCLSFNQFLFVLHLNKIFNLFNTLLALKWSHSNFFYKYKLLQIHYNMAHLNNENVDKLSAQQHKEKKELQGI